MVLLQSTVKQCDTDTIQLKTVTDWMVPMLLWSFQNIKWIKNIFWEDLSMFNYSLLIHQNRKSVKRKSFIKTWTAAYKHKLAIKSHQKSWNQVSARRRRPGFSNFGFVVGIAKQLRKPWANRDDFRDEKEDFKDLGRRGRRCSEAPWSK